MNNENLNNQPLQFNGREAFSCAHISDEASEYFEDYISSRNILVNFASQLVTTENDFLATTGNGTPLRDRYNMPFAILTPDQTLSQLIRYEAFSESERLVRVPEYGDFNINEFFVHFSQLNRCYFGQFHGFWGTVSRIYRIENKIVFRPNGYRNSQLGITSAHYNATGLTDIDPDNNIEMLVFGTLIDSGYGIDIDISDPSHCALRISRN